MLYNFTYIVVFSFICFDVVTGILKAVYKGIINSQCLRKGLIHKFTEILTLVGCGLIDYSADYYGIDKFPDLVSAFSIYICTMELISIIENLSEVNPVLGGFFKPYLEKLKKGEQEK